MIIKSCTVSNFASYNQLKFNFQQKGLSLIQGPTGSGKSTLCDIIPWVLFGKTAKGGNADEILNWQKDDTAIGSVSLQTATQHIVVTRSRGSKGNDLYFIASGEFGQIRGSNLFDTQKLLNEKLNLTYDTYLAGAYFHEFSQTASFFISTAKNRRMICEQIIDLSLAKTLQIKLSEEKKEITTRSEKARNDLYVMQNNLQFTGNNIEAAIKSKNKWDTERKARLAELASKSRNFIEEQEATITLLANKHVSFESDRSNKIQELNNRLKQAVACPVCIKNKASFERELKVAFRLENPYDAAITREQDRKNNYKDQAKALASSINPHQETIDEQNEKFSSLIAKIETIMLVAVIAETKLLDIEQMLEVIARFRSTLAEQTVEQLEQNTNDLLSRHFDAEIKVEFQIEDADKLEVAITKDGHSCVYSQLSKGQRQLLKLCFGISVMKQVSQHHGINFNTIFLDEALDGLDDNFKTKAYYLLKELEQQYESIFVVEHSESLKALFDNKYTVSLENGASTLEKT